MLARRRWRPSPPRPAITTITLVELAAGRHATDDPAERARRQQRLQLAEATFDPLPFDAACARAYGLVYAQTLTAGRRARGSRAVDLLIAPPHWRTSCRSTPATSLNSQSSDPCGRSPRFQQSHEPGGPTHPLQTTLLG